MKKKSLLICNVGFLSLIFFIGCTHWKEQYKYGYFNKYDSTQIGLIKTNWNQFFAVDIGPQLAPTIHMFPLFMDGYGCIYPDDSILSGITGDEFAHLQHYKKQTNLCFITLFNNKRRISENVNQTSNPDRKRLYKELLSHTDSIEMFNTTWQNYFVNHFQQRLRDELTRMKKDSVVFFIHGYNVPYSLATIQCIEFVKLASQNGVDTSKYLFVPVYWPSNDEKNSDLDSGKFDTHNHFKLRNYSKWSRYSNRAYFGAITLRQIIAGLPANISVRIFSHSLGATMATTVLINTTSKLDPSRNPTINIYLNELMIKHPIPDRKVTVFMNAPAIPGYTTFEDISPDTGRNYWFYVGYNQQDEMVTKKKMLANSRIASSSTLGANPVINGIVDSTEVQRTLAIMQKRGLGNNIFANATGVQTDHDILSYYYQTGFNQMQKIFFNVLN